MEWPAKYLKRKSCDLGTPWGLRFNRRAVVLRVAGFMHFRLHIVVSIPFPVSLYNPNIIVVSIGDKLLPQDAWYLLRSLALSTKLDKFGQIILVKPKTGAMGCQSCLAAANHFLFFLLGL